MEKFPIIDADGHVTESNESLRKHLKTEYRNRPLMHSEAWDRSFGGTLGKRNEEPKTQLADMDIDGIDIQVIFPSHLHSMPRRRRIWRRTLLELTTTGLPSSAPPTQGGSRAWRWWPFRMLTPQSAKRAAP